MYHAICVDMPPAILQGSGQAHGNAVYSHLLPGKILHLSDLLEMRKFRDRGNKEGAVRGFRVLEEAELGKLIEVKPQRGTNMVNIFHFVE